METQTYQKIQSLCPNNKNGQQCEFGLTCSYWHRLTPCKYGKHCDNRSICTYYHTQSEKQQSKYGICRNGGECDDEDCKFTHAAFEDETASTRYCPSIMTLHCIKMRMRCPYTNCPFKHRRDELCNLNDGLHCFRSKCFFKHNLPDFFNGTNVTTIDNRHYTIPYNVEDAKCNICEESNEKMWMILCCKTDDNINFLDTKCRKMWTRINPTCHLCRQKRFLLPVLNVFG